MTWNGWKFAALFISSLMWVVIAWAFFNWLGWRFGG